MRQSRFGQSDCEEGNHYNNCAMCQRFVGHAPAMGIHKTASPWEYLKRGAQLGIFFAFNSAVMSAKIYIFTKYNTLLNKQTYICLYYAYGPLMGTVWPIHGIPVP